VMRRPGPGAVLAGRDPRARAEPTPEARSLDQMKQTAGRYKIVMEAEPPVTLSLLPEPALHWNNPLRTGANGILILWTSHGRPEVAGTVYRKGPESFAEERHEFQSLSATPLSATIDGRVIWAPRTAGIELKPIPAAPAPATTRAERLRQMRALARDFQAEMDAGTGPTSLRLLTQPLHRYEPDRADITDGALFAFVQATDP